MFSFAPEKSIFFGKPFFYGWTVLFLVCCVGFVRAAPAVATLSIFVTPMIDSFGWSRLSMSGAVSLGGVLAALTSPIIGSLMDRHGPRVILISAVTLTGLSCISLSFINNLFFFYLAFCIARMNFAGPFDLGIYGAINNWFVRRRLFATSVANLSQTLGLALIPLIASTAILWGSWRTGWIIIGLLVYCVGLIPAFLLRIPRPESIGLLPDGIIRNTSESSTTKKVETENFEPEFSRSDALRTKTFWLLSLFTLLVFPVQAGVSLHQAPHLLQQGLSASEAAIIVSLFSTSAACMTLLTGVFGKKISISFFLFLSGVAMSVSTFLMLSINSLWDGLTSGIIFGASLGAILTLLPLAWADFFGRKNYGAIRGIALTIQVVSQALGPVISGLMWDLDGNYFGALKVYTAFAFFASGLVLFAHPPKRLYREKKIL